jgi:hypothetical protein
MKAAATIVVLSTVFTPPIIVGSAIVIQRTV